MPVSLPEAYRAPLAHNALIGLPAGTWLLAAWTVVMLELWFFASFNLDAVPMDQFELLSNF